MSGQARDEGPGAFLDRGRVMRVDRLGATTERLGRPAERVRISAPDGRAYEALVAPEAIVTLARGVPAEEVWSSLGVRPVRELMPETRAWLVVDAAGLDGAALAARLAAQVRTRRWITAAVPDLHLARVPSQFRVPPDDPRYPGQWYLARLGIERVWARASGSPDVSIAVVDNGCEEAHPDLRANVRPGRDALDRDDDPSFLPGQRGNNHGTACAGVIAAVGDNDVGVAGVCPRCTLRCVRLLGARGTRVPVSADIEAFAWSLREGVAVVSNSWGFGESLPAPGPLVDAIEAVVDRGRGGRGALVVFAAGNENREVASDEVYGVRGVLTVGAVNNFDEATSFSNRGAPLTLTAPTGTVTTDLTGAEGENAGDYTALFGGTSSSCPVVSGVAGLLLSARPTSTAREVFDALRRTARPAPFARPDAQGHDPVYGYGVVDPAAALSALIGPPDASAPDASAPDASAAAPPPTEPGCGCRATPATTGRLAPLAVLACIAGRRRPRTKEPRR